MKKGYSKSNGFLILLIIILILLVIGLWFYPTLTKTLVGAAIAKIKNIIT